MADIQHVVVLMLENRSFDSLLGTFRASTPKFNGLKGSESNRIGNLTYRARHDLPGGGSFAIPTPDPGESYVDITEQLFYPHDWRGAYPPTMGGFANNYAIQSPSDGFHDPQAVMHTYTEEQVPVLHQLAKAFAVSDQWFASAPCQTWPNRFFAHTGTCYGVVNNKDFFGAGQEPFRRRSIFRELENARQPWRVYFHDFPQSLLLADILDVAASHYHRFKQFLVDAEAGVLPAYSFIEPNYFANIFTGTPPNDQHPPHDIRYGEKLIADVYNAVRASSCWEKTLLIITYDEHGGCYDHVPPPRAVPPGDGKKAPDGFAFDTYGVRVPAVIVTPWVRAGSVLSPLGDGPYPFDHTSIIKTVRELFGIPGPLTDRDAAAPSVLPYLRLAAPFNSGPGIIVPQALQPSRAEMQQLGNAWPNELLKALGAAAERLDSGFKTIERDLSLVAETVAQIGTRAVAQVEAFLNRF
ncbi:MAG: alkaline phosphatase family protein [Paralcaligenes sp.]